MKLFAKGKGSPVSAPAPPAAFQPIERNGLLGLLDQVVNSGQSGMLELVEPRGTWLYAFQGGALTHASGGRVRGARQAFDLLWEFQQGEFRFTPGTEHGMGSNLYIDKSRLLDLLHRSQAALQGPASPYIPADQQRPIAPVNPGYAPPGWAPQGQPAGPAPGWATGGYPGAAQAYPQQAQQPYPQPYPQPPQQPYPQPGFAPQGAPAGYQPPAPVAPAGYPQPVAPQGYPVAPQGYPVPQQMPPPQPQPFQAPPGPQPGQFQAQPAPQPPLPEPSAPVPARPATPPSFSVPPMAIPRKREAMPAYAPPPAAAVPPPAPAPEPPKAAPVDDLKALRASLVAQAPPVGPQPAASWNVRKADGTVAPPPVPTGARAGKNGKRPPSALRRGVEVRLIKFLLWACERQYSADDHWSLKDAFEVSTMELKEQFVGAFSQSFKSTPRAGVVDDDEGNQMTAGRMRGRAKSRKR